MFYDSGWICAGNKTEKIEEEKKRHSSYKIQCQLSIPERMKWSKKMLQGNQDEATQTALRREKQREIYGEINKIGFNFLIRL